MSFQNPLHERRLVIIKYLPDAYARVQSAEVLGAEKIYIVPSDESSVMYKVKEVGSENGQGDLYNFPVLFHKNGKPWYEANDYLLSLARNCRPEERPTDEIRRRASKLIDYLLFCEKNDLDWLDFSGARPPLRPTYKYFHYLISYEGRNKSVINQYTSVVYDLYSHVSKYWHEIDMRRVDTVKSVSMLISTSKGKLVKSVIRRSQTVITPGAGEIPLGFVREDGEDLRPLSNSELKKFMRVLEDDELWSPIERLILLSSLFTGARKQTVLTMRLKHLKGFSEDKLLPEGAYKLHAGPGTGIDTKFNKPQDLYFPRELSKKLIILAKSPLMKRRQEKFKQKIKKEYPDFSIEEEDIYLFLSEQGNPYYMAKDDPRYPIVKTPQFGQVTDTIKKKLLRAASNDFPSDFSYHWLRATYAYQLYQRLDGLVRK